MTNFSDSFETAKPSRPTFLTVLCILTFLGSGYGLISNIGAYMTAGTQAKTMKVVTSEMKSTTDSLSTVADSTKSGKANPGQEFAESLVNSMSTMFTEENVKKSSLFSIAAAALCLIGAVLMWMLKKTGFYAYVAGTLLGLAGPIVVFGAGNFIAIIGTMIGGFIGLIFVVLYGVNLKHLR
jgi:hypothetical protein